jgi:hypothetical protein
MPPFEEVKAQVLEVRAFIMRLQAAMRTEAQRAVGDNVSQEAVVAEHSAPADRASGGR